MTDNKDSLPLGKESSHLAGLFIAHASGMRIRYDFCPDCKGETLHIIDTMGGVRMGRCDLCGRTAPYTPPAFRNRS